MMPIVTRAKSKDENLCDTCKFCIATCNPEEGLLEFGDGIGEDNVIACPTYSPGERAGG